MNIFVLHEQPEVAARMHCNKHVVKMIVEYAQLLSTAHRILDGQLILLDGPKRQHRALVLPGETAFLKLDPRPKVDFHNRMTYNATHANHPSAIWVRETSSNYEWLLDLLKNVLSEYEVRYNKHHSTNSLLGFLSKVPNNILKGGLTVQPQAMPEKYHHQDVVQAYRNYYLGEKLRFAKYTNREIPDWIKASTQN